MTHTAGYAGPPEGATPDFGGVRPAARAPHKNEHAHSPHIRPRLALAARLRRIRPLPQRPATAFADALLWVVATCWAAACRYDFELARVHWPAVLALGMLAGAGQLLAGCLCALYRNRYNVGSLHECRALACSALAVALAGSVAVLAYPVEGVPRSLPALAFPFAVLLTGLIRFLQRSATEHRRRPAPNAERVLIYGAGDVGELLAMRMLRDPESPFLPVGFVDDDPAKRNLRLSGIRVVGSRTALPAVARDRAVTGVVVALDRSDAVQIRRVADAAAKARLRCMIVPPLDRLRAADTESSPSSDKSTERLRLADVRDVDVADMIGRQPIDTDVAGIGRYLTGKRVLVTGAGGSIGSELCRQIHRFAPAELVMLDRDESALHAVQLSIYGQGLLDSPHIVLADIRDRGSLAQAFAKVRPEVVFHAAALKHLPLLERYPLEAWNTNVMGTLNVLEVAAETGVGSLVNISTDKAADPVSALGYSKRLAEQLTAWMSRRTGAAYLSVRFGNVLGSRGSVLHAFHAQIDAGGPVTVTDPRVTRYFMTISEACQLVVQAGAIGRPGEALVLDMGAPVRILDVARRMIAVSGKHVDIVYTGLRDGEKLHEALHGKAERDQRPVHPLISHVTVPPVQPEDLLRQRWAHRLLGHIADGSEAGDLLVGGG
jgi:FlaA1/EpsC-like NDP-sugar epimerase